MRLLFLLGAALPLAACMAAGGGTGAVTSPHGRPAGPARVEFTTNGGATAEMTVTLPDGEAFRGPAVSGRRQAGPGLGFGPGKGDVFITAPGRAWTGEITAALRSAAGRTMDCRLTEKRTGLGLEGGAAGHCTVSDGRRVQIDIL
ncbi:hypothetical protein [Tabrizicola flagellatus]|uniref:hypothetical protein n=1 Tax=Tabrizicola flagellatus TaxID=2593021 RepID=UPI001F461474|nr:hypothetical protein [Tabrizicola flagellatus]